jgi:acyl carrier protein
VNRDEAVTLVVDAVRAVAPDVDPAVDPDADFQADLDLDSMDLLNVVIAVHERTGLDIPERDYGSLTSVSRFAEYVAARAA